MRYVNGKIICAMLFGSLFASQAGAADRPVVYELFTSQGCSSCPPADRLATRLADDPDVLVLSYHVSYWNYLGWKDPYSSDASTGRQYAYSRAMQSTRVYTPQGVVQGIKDVVGSRERGVKNAITAQKQGPWIASDVKRTGQDVVIDLPQHETLRAELFLVGYAKRTQNAVPRGENSGRELSHRNSVTEIIPLGAWDGNAKQLNHALKDERSDGVALLIQAPGQGAILGGGWL